jgi:hypothetical protein
MLDHEPGTDCPNSPNTCITCEPKRAAAENAVVRFNATYPGLRARLGGSSQDKSFSPDSPDFEGGHK